MNMIEKVARGIFEVDSKRPFINRIVYGTDTPTWELVCSEHVIPSIKEEYINRAKAAILAMREPSEGMLRTLSVSYDNEDDVKQLYSDCIDAALKEE